MSSARPRLLRPSIAVAAVGALLVASVGPTAAGVPPEQPWGEIGHYAIFEGPDDPIVSCRYQGTAPPKLVRFVARPPSIWWPDTSSASDTQHGRVGWQVRIQETTDPDSGPWSTVFISTVIKRTASEDQPPYSQADAADFTKRTFTWSSSSSTKVFRLVYRLIWYRKDGTHRGRLTHWVQWYKRAGSGDGGATSGHCWNEIWN